MVEVREPFVCEHVRFKNKTNFACVDVFKVDYTDGSGLPGWEIKIAPAYGGDEIAGETDGTGWVRFNGLVPGSYIVSETMQKGWLPVSETSQMVTLKASGRCAELTFVNVQETAPKPKEPAKKDPPKKKKEPAPKKGCHYRYTVKKCDTLSSIAARYGTSIRNLMRANNIQNPNVIYVGQRLCIP
jgi:LysM repeat protein